MRTTLRAWRASLFASLGLLPFAGCGEDIQCTDGVLEPSGLVRCSEGWLHRPGPARCDSVVPRDFSVLSRPRKAGDQCEFDADCQPPLRAFCVELGAPSPRTSCVRGCVSDDQCPPGKACVCGDPIGTCQSAECSADRDCDTGYCRALEQLSCSGLPTFTLACVNEDDECQRHEDCEGFRAECGRSGGATECFRSDIVCGRPFLVDGRARLSAKQASTEWSAPVAADLKGLSETTRARLAGYWTELGLMEHASVAAFSRFILELLALGAPASLVTDASLALADEITHAQLCFGIASACAGTPIGAGPLPLDGALASRTRVELGLSTFREACLGEALATAEAVMARDQARDPAIRAALARIADDEARHTELGFRFVKWLLDTISPPERQALCAGLQRELFAASAGERVHPASTGEPASAPGHGMPGRAARTRARRAAFEEVVRPCTLALLSVPRPMPARVTICDVA